MRPSPPHPITPQRTATSPSVTESTESSISTLQLVFQQSQTTMSIPRLIPRNILQARSFTSSAYNAQKASHAYHIPPTPGAGPSRPTPPPPRTKATTEKPILTPEEQQVIDRIVRVDQAGELGANWIYRGQKMGMSIRGDRKAVKQIDVCPHSILRLLLL
jgi:hypothetical protein